MSVEDILKTKGMSAVATAAGVSYESVRKWATAGEVPPDRLEVVVRCTQAPPWVLAPRLYQSIGAAERAYADLRAPVPLSS